MEVGFSVKFRVQGVEGVGCSALGHEEQDHVPLLCAARSGTVQAFPGAVCEVDLK